MNARSSTRWFSGRLCSTVQLWTTALIGCLIQLALPVLAVEPASEDGAGTQHWRRGNLHTHSFWSDGDDFPESVAKWYKDQGYDFLALTDHNILLEGEKWKPLPEQHPALARYRQRFGDEWAEIRPADGEGHLEVRLRALDEFRALFEEPRRFLLIMGNEITDRHAVHLVALHQDRILPTVGGSESERLRMIRDIVAQVDDDRASSGRNTHAILAHPNYQWAITAEMIAEAANLRFFEVYNGHSAVNSDGDAHRASTDRMWDIVLALRLSGDSGKRLYGVATDDAHHYFGGANGPGRGWVMVDSASLTPESILDALDRGDFYATTGVALRTIKQSGDKIFVEIAPREGVQYVTEYIGTRRGVDLTSTPTVDASGKEIPNTTRTYSDGIGAVLHRATDLSSSYTFSGDELYVRVRVTSSADQVDPVTGASLGGKQRAWGQPMIFTPGAHRHTN